MALIFTLGILTILMILGLAFVMLSQTNRKLASVNSDVTTARLIAESALERILGSIESYNDDLTQGKIYPGTSSFFDVSGANSGTGSTDAGWDNRRVIFSFQSSGDTDWVHNLKTTFNNSAGFPFNYIGWYGSNSASFKSAVPVTWKYIKTNDGTSDKILGRIAYMIIDESGKIDPNRVAASGTNEAVFESRPGVNVTEINLQGAGVSSAAATALGYDNAGGKRPSAAKWFSWAHIIGGDTGLDQDQIDNYTGSLFPFSYDIEACWIDTNGNGKHDSGEDFNRFNLARTDWNSLTLSDILENPAVFDISIKTYDGDGIKWLNDFSEKGEFTSVSARKNQIAANLLDYCDSDSVPRTDYVAGGAPTYVGLEKTAYINEVHVNISQTPVVKAAAMGGASYTWIPVVISITPEIVNVYSDSVEACNLELEYQINGIVNKGHAASFTLKSMEAGVPVEKLTGTLTYNFAATAAHSFQTVLAQQVMFLGDSYVTADEGLPVNLTITDIKLTAFLKDPAGNLIDFASVATDATPVDLDVHPSQKYANYQANDPRHNQFLANWNTKTGDADQGSLGFNNAGTCMPGASGDQDSGSEPWVSTCFIRNAPMQSPWELGCIHRGGVWETINLKAFNTASGVTGGGSYANGDANILDQVKMTSDTVNSGKININSPSKNALKALVRNIYVGGNYATPGGSTGVVVSDPIAGNIADAILALNGSAPGITAFTSRAAVANVSQLLSAVPGQDTDAEKEEIIGKFINLTTVRQNLFTVIILAQAIKDVGGNGTDITINKDLNSNGDISGSVSEATAGWDIDGQDTDNDRDPANDPTIADMNTDSDGNPETIAAQLGRYDQYADEIVSEQKILAVIYRDAFTNKCKILYYEYLSE